MTASGNASTTLRFGSGPPVNTPRWSLPEPVRTCWALLSAALLAFIVRITINPASEMLDHFLYISSAVTCGLAWLFARSLFRQGDELREIWPVVLVASLFCLVMLSAYTDRSLLFGINLVDPSLALGSSAILVLTLLEPLSGLRRELARTERRFRWLFFAGYGSILFAGVILRKAGDVSKWFDSHQEHIHVTCAVAALVAATFAVRYRIGQAAISSRQRISEGRDNANSSEQLANRLWDVLAKEQLYLDPDLRVASLCRRLDVPSYKISRVISSHLGFANFSRLINSLRLEAARTRLADPDRASDSVMTIAFDCGFASIGPFNRAFKERFGITPRAYRAKHIEASEGE